jgi:hypothetical protein
MTTRTPNAPPRSSRKFFVIAGVIVVMMIAAIFIGMNAQHAKDMQDKQAGQVKPQDLPLTEKDLGRSPPAK